MLRRSVITLLAALTLLSGLSGCSAPEQIEESERLVIMFHNRMDREAYEEVWQLTSTDFQQTNVKIATLDFFRAVRGKLGIARESVLAGATYEANAGELPTITLTYQTEFEHGYGEETFVFTVDRGRTELWGYHINSNDLILMS